MKSADVGDKIVVEGKSVTISKILSQDYWDRFGFDIEFVDGRGQYRHWKQHEDGGELIKNC